MFVLQLYHENRLKYIASIENAYPHKFNVTMSDQTYLEKFGGLENGEHKEDITVSLAGREKIATFIFIGYHLSLSFGLLI